MRVLALLIVVCFTSLVRAAVSPDAEEAMRYHLLPRDMIRVSVFGEPDLNVERRIDGNGIVSLPLVGSLKVQGLTVASAEEAIRKLYVDKEIFVRPQISVSVVEYVKREISVMGSVKDPGKILLPIETESIDIVDAITKAGGFTRLGRAETVRVTRRLAGGKEDSFVVDVQKMLNGTAGPKPVMVFAGDYIFVPERVF